jgi:membrane protein YdbS with pleckstrin-like domain
MLAIIGFFLAFGITLLKLHLGDALRLWGIVLGVIIILLGVAVILAREWSEFAAGVWIFIGIVLLFLFQNKLKRKIAIFNIADKFEEIIDEESEKLS